MTEEPIFKNLKVIDLSSVLAGPSVGTFFAELGAEVIKIEHPDHPDITRSWKLPEEDKSSSISAYFSSINYQKTYRQLNLKKESQRAELFSELETADVVLMNFKYGDQEKLKITDPLLHKINPKLIIGKINGFGAENDRVAYDLILQAESGFMSMNGTPESGPVKMPIALIDVLTAHHLKEGILIELINRERDKNYKGKSINVSLYDAAVSSLVNQASNYLMNDHVPQRIGSLHPNIAPYGELFETADGKTITFAIGSNRHFKRLCQFLEMQELADHPDFSSVQQRVENRTALYEKLKKQVGQFEAEFILNWMKKEFVPCGEVKDLAGVFATSRAQNLIRREKIGRRNTERVSSIAFRKS